jgi:hypothetical protein
MLRGCLRGLRVAHRVLGCGPQPLVLLVGAHGLHFLIAAVSRKVLLLIQVCKL